MLPACLNSETLSHFRDPSGLSAYSSTSPFNTAPFRGQSGGPANDDLPLVGSALQYMPEQDPGCFITNEPDVDVVDIFRNEDLEMDLLANDKVSISRKETMAEICI